MSTPNESSARVVGRRTAQVVVACAIAALPLGAGTATASVDGGPTPWDGISRCESTANWSPAPGDAAAPTAATWQAFGGPAQDDPPAAPAEHDTGMPCIGS